MKTKVYPIIEFIRAFEIASKGRTASQTFDDFLTLSMSFFTKKQNTDFTYYNEEVLSIIKAYRETGTYDELVRLPAIMLTVLDTIVTYPDIIGDFYMGTVASEQEKKFQSPYHICREITDTFRGEAIGYVCVMDTAVKSGRMLIAFDKGTCERHRYYGIETNPILSKLCALNMFIHNLSGEVICAEESDPEKFKVGYRVSFAPAGIFKIDQKENSQVWLMNRDVFGKMRKENPQKRLLFF